MQSATLELSAAQLRWVHRRLSRLLFNVQAASDKKLECAAAACSERQVQKEPNLSRNTPTKTPAWLTREQGAFLLKWPEAADEEPSANMHRGRAFYVWVGPPPRQFQGCYGVSGDGVVDRATWAPLSVDRVKEWIVDKADQDTKTPEDWSVPLGFQLQCILRSKRLRQWYLSFAPAQTFDKD